MGLLMYFSTNYNEIAHIKIQCAINYVPKQKKGDETHLLFFSCNFGIFIACPSFNVVLPSRLLYTST